MHWRQSLLLAAVLPVPWAAFAARPLTLDDAWPVAPMHIEIEAGVTYYRAEGSSTYDIPLGIGFGVAPTLAIGIGFGGALEARDALFNLGESEGGLGDFEAGFKWNPLSQDRWFFDHALRFIAKFPTADANVGTGQYDFDLTYIASKELSDQWSVHFNAGYTWIGDTAEEPLEDIVHTGVATGWFVHERVELVAELYADLPIGRERDTALVAAGGVRWNVAGTLILDALAGAGLAGKAPDWLVTVGFTWTFGLKRSSSP